MWKRLAEAASAASRRAVAWRVEELQPPSERVLFHFARAGARGEQGARGEEGAQGGAQGAMDAWRVYSDAIYGGETVCAWVLRGSVRPPKSPLSFSPPPLNFPTCRPSGSSTATLAHATSRQRRACRVGHGAFRGMGGNQRRGDMLGQRWNGWQRRDGALHPTHPPSMAGKHELCAGSSTITLKLPSPLVSSFPRLPPSSLSPLPLFSLSLSLSSPSLLPLLSLSSPSLLPHSLLTSLPCPNFLLPHAPFPPSLWQQQYRHAYTKPSFLGISRLSGFQCAHLPPVFAGSLSRRVQGEEQGEGVEGRGGRLLKGGFAGIRTIEVSVTCGWYVKGTEGVGLWGGQGGRLWWAIRFRRTIEPRFEGESELR
ncbi:unnamed protein product [Closterium sp. NIES-65]|nr:unnamed protein product [Closterium sp. NIES-65]